MKKRLYIMICLTVVVFAVLSISKISFFEFLELKLFDQYFALRGELKASPNIIVAAIDEKSLKTLGQWPWDRAVMADLVKKIRDSGAKVVAFDVVFAEKDRAGHDEQFATELKKTDGAVIGNFFDKNAIVSNVPILNDAARSGYLNVEPDRDGIIRRISMIKAVDASEPANSFPLEVISKFYGFTKIVKKDGAGNLTDIIIGNKKIPVDERGRMIVNFLGRGGTFKYISAGDIINDDFNKDELKDAIVLVGATAAGLFDIRATPLSAAIAGIEIHASAIDNVLTGRYLKRSAVSDIINFAGILFAGALSLVVFTRFGIASSTAVFLLMMAGTFGAGNEAFRNGIWIPLIYILLEFLALFISIMLFRYFTEGREKRRISEAFKFYLAPNVIDELLKDAGGLKLGGEKREITVLFSDVRNFTTISESLPPEKLVTLMNEYFTAMTDIIMEEGGLLDKYIGDAIMAFFGAPMEQNDHAQRSVRAAMRMGEKLREIEPRFCETYGVKAFKNGIGLNSGPAYVGNMGSSRRFNYTAIGDTVNVAARLEGLTKEFAVPLLISASVVEKCGNIFQFKELGSSKVKGRVEEVKIFTIE